MPRNTTPRREADTSEILKDLLIVQLGVAGVRNHDIRTIVGCDMNRVTRIVKHLKSATKTSARKEG